MQTSTVVYTGEGTAAEYANSVEFERSNDIHEIATNIAERIGYPMNHLVDYELINGEAWCVTAREPKPMRQITLEGVEDGMRMYSGNNAFQLERLQIEHEESLEVDKMFRGDLEGNVMVVMSQIPDAVRDGLSTVDGYRADIMRSTGRIYYVTDDKRYRCRFFSVDQTNPAAMNAMAKVLGADYKADDTSEHNLARRRLVRMSSVTDNGVAELVTLGVGVYDTTLSRETGVTSNAGSRFLDQKDALAVVKLHGELLEECRRNISIIAASGLADEEKGQRVEQQLKKTTGAINAAVDGHSVSSSQDGIAAEYVATHNYENDCPTGATPLERTAAQQKGEVKMTCPHCGLTTVGDPCGAVLTCTRCDAQVVNKVLRSRGIGRKAALAREAAEKEKNEKLFKTEENNSGNGILFSNSLDRIKQIRTVYGANAEEIRTKALGEELRYVRDKTTGEFVAWLE